MSPGFPSARARRRAGPGLQHGARCPRKMSRLLIRQNFLGFLFMDQSRSVFHLPLAWLPTWAVACPDQWECETATSPSTPQLTSPLAGGPAQERSHLHDVVGSCASNAPSLCFCTSLTASHPSKSSPVAGALFCLSPLADGFPPGGSSRMVDIGCPGQARGHGRVRLLAVSVRVGGTFYPRC